MDVELLGGLPDNTVSFTLSHRQGEKILPHPAAGWLQLREVETALHRRIHTYIHTYRKFLVSAGGAGGVRCSFHQIYTTHVRFTKALFKKKLLCIRFSIIEVDSTFHCTIATVGIITFGVVVIKCIHI